MDTVMDLIIKLNILAIKYPLLWSMRTHSVRVSMDVVCDNNKVTVPYSLTHTLKHAAGEQSKSHLQDLTKQTQRFFLSPNKCC